MLVEWFKWQLTVRLSQGRCYEYGPPEYSGWVGGGSGGVTEGFTIQSGCVSCDWTVTHHLGAL